jgi:uncharacterized protein YndB with AHSA1/START domain
MTTESSHSTGSEVSDDEIVIECDLPAPPSKVWRALTVPELLSAWLLTDDIRPLTARPVTPQKERDSGQGAGSTTTHFELLDAEPQRRLRYRWSTHHFDGASEQLLESVLSFELTPAAGGTHLRIVHGDFRESARFACVSAVSAIEPVRPVRTPPVAFARRQTGAQAGSWSTAQGLEPWVLRRAA